MNYAKPDNVRLNQMKPLLKVLVLAALILYSYSGFGQILKPISWQYHTSELNEIGELDLIFTATIDGDWYLYSSDFDPELGPMVTTFEFKPHNSYELVGEIRPIDPKQKYDEIFEGDYTYFIGTGVFRQTIKLLSESPEIIGSFFYQVCTDIDGKCIPFEDDFTSANFGFVNQSRSDPFPPAFENQIESTQENFEGYEGDPVNSTMLGFMAFAFLSGLIALLTPCVFPMIPMTVTFFMKEDGTGNGIKKGIVFGLSIIGIFTILGLGVAFLFGADTLNQLATHWFPNILVFLIFTVFAMSFLGMFELTLPSALVNKVDKQADRGGYGGVFFMAATLALVSFSCTFPIVGSVLVLSAAGEFMKPILGMFAFAMAFALPFSLFAIFPEWLKKMPKSGGWLNSVKVVLGFLELALGLKFLSIADQAYHWNILDREVYLAIWIVIFTLLGLYLLGKIRLSHDSKIEALGVPRLMMAIGTFTFVLYLIPGMWGAPLKALAGYLPPMTTHDFNIVQLLEAKRSNGLISNSICEDPKYSTFLEFPHGIEGYFDYQQAINCARQQNKPLFIDFTGHGCVNCREMEARVWSDPKVLNRLKNNFVLVALYVDDKTKLPENEWLTSTYDGKIKKTIGKQNADFQITRYNNNAQPFYVILDDQEEILRRPIAYNLDVDNFIKFLDSAKDEYYRRTSVVRK